MNSQEALRLTRLVAELVPGTRLGQDTHHAWAFVLDDVSFDDAIAALRTVYRDRGSDAELGARRLEADDIRREVKRMRAARLAAAPPFVPSSPDLTPAEQIAELRAYYGAAAAGAPLPSLPATGNRALPLPSRAERGGEPRRVGALRLPPPR